jgi:anti-sigma factor ChrR (cupin superfamily)
MTEPDRDHPRIAELVAFALGFTDRQTSLRVETHLAACEACCRTVAEAEDDPLLTLVRASRLKAPTE